MLLVLACGGGGGIATDDHNKDMRKRLRCGGAVRSHCLLLLTGTDAGVCRLPLLPGRHGDRWERKCQQCMLCCVRRIKPDLCDCMHYGIP